MASERFPHGQTGDIGFARAVIDEDAPRRSAGRAPPSSASARSCPIGSRPAARSSCRARASARHRGWSGCHRLVRVTLFERDASWPPSHFTAGDAPDGTRLAVIQSSRAAISPADSRKPKLGPPPDDILGAAGPFVRHQVPDFALGQSRRRTTGRDRPAISHCRAILVARVP